MAFNKKSVNGFNDGGFVLLSDSLGENPYGTFELLEYTTARSEFNFPEPKTLTEDLQLIYGIGNATAARLRKDGYGDIFALLGHHRWQRAATELVKAIESKDLVRLVRYGAKELQLLCFFNPEEICFIDIETTGLYYMQPLFLVGLLKFEANRGRITQLLARNYDEEKAVLHEAFSNLNKMTLIVSFNGRSFDLPYLKNRLRFHGLDNSVPDTIPDLHLDLLHPSRKLFAKALPNCRLLTLEQNLLNRERDGDIPGALVAEYYSKYLDTGKREYLDPILYHNACDLIAMTELLGLLSQNQTSQRKVAEIGD